MTCEKHWEGVQESRLLECCLQGNQMQILLGHMMSGLSCTIAAALQLLIVSTDLSELSACLFGLIRSHSALGVVS